LSGKVQPAPLVFGVAPGVFIFSIMTALILGLAECSLDNPVGDISHVTIEAKTEDPAVLIAPSDTMLGLDVTIADGRALTD
jgi:hypothetical protein